MSQINYSKLPALNLPPYIFAAINELKDKARADGKEIIDFGMGNPDTPPPNHVMNRISELAHNPKLYGYSVVGGIESLKIALKNHYARRFGVDLNANKECLVTIGAKEGIVSLGTALCGPEDIIAVANPGYPIHTFAFIIAKSNILPINATEPTEFLQQFKEKTEETKKNGRKPKAVIVNYPSNPTSQIASLSFYEELVEFCLKEEIFIISDIAYSEIYFSEETKPPSILQVKNAKKIAVELSSVSKSYSMAGCRIGFVAGNAEIIAELFKIKSYLDYGSFTPLQMAVVDAMSEKSDEYIKNLRQKYQNRAKFLANLLQKELKWKVDEPKASMFLWAKIPDHLYAATQTTNSFAFCQKLIEKTGVALCAGSSFGSGGENYARISLIHDENNTIKAINKIKNLTE